MTNFLENEKIIESSIVDSPTERELQFLDLTGRKAFWSQGFKGKGEVVAVLDTGITPHDEFGDRLLQGRNFSSDHMGSPNITTDHHSHGTHCAGSIVGKKVGIAPEAEVVPVKVLNTMGGGTVEDVIAGINWCSNWRHPKTGQKLTAISMSLSFPTLTSQQLSDLTRAVERLVKMDIAVFCSAGNTARTEIRYPAGLEDVICVGAVDYEKKQAWFTTQGNHVDICNIGVDVLSACHLGGYSKMSGTSMSTPLSAGLSLLLANKYKSIYKRPIKEGLLYEMVKFHTKDLGIKGADPIFGAGFFTLQPLEMEIDIQTGSNVIRINGEDFKMEVPPQIINGRFMIPVRFVTDPAGAYVVWFSGEDRRTTGARVVF